jgi:hypothetical protein
MNNSRDNNLNNVPPQMTNTTNKTVKPNRLIDNDKHLRYIVHNPGPANSRVINAHLIDDTAPPYDNGNKL